MMLNKIRNRFFVINWDRWLPSPGNVVFAVVVAIALFWAQSAHALPWASAPTAAASTAVWPYQGRLSSSTGTPVTAALPMTFRLYNVASGGTALWQEQWTSVQVTGGLFNVALGSQTAIPQSILSNSSLWLGITVGTDTEMTPRVQLGSTPFAWTVPDGSITAAKLAANAINSQNVNLSTGRVSAVIPNGGMFSLSASDQTVPGTTTTVGSKTSQVYLVFITVDVETSDGAGGSLYVDGVSMSSSSGDAHLLGYGTNVRATVSQVYRITLAPGIHTLEIKANGGTTSGSIVWEKHTSLTYFAVAP